MRGRGTLGELDDQGNVITRRHLHLDPVGTAFPQLDAEVVPQQRSQLTYDRLRQSKIDRIVRVEMRDLLAVTPNRVPGSEHRAALDDAVAQGWFAPER